MLELRLLGQFQVQIGGQVIALPSRAAQSLLAFLALHAGTAVRREKLAGLIWPDISEAIARGYLRHELWRIRKTIGSNLLTRSDFLIADEITIAFSAEAEYWLDALLLQMELSDGASVEDWMNVLALYRGELLPGFYDDWIVPERERLQAVFEQKISKLLERLVLEERWEGVLDWGERWITFGQAPEPAYRMLMLAHATQGNLAQVTADYQRCVDALREELGVEPSEQTRALLEQLTKQDAASFPSSFILHAERSSLDSPAPGEPPYKGLEYFDEADAGVFFGRELLTARLLGRLRENRFLAIIVGASGSGKSSIVRAGLVPALKRGAPLADGTLPPEGSIEWRIHILTPTAQPLDALASALTQDAHHAATLTAELGRDPRALQSFLQDTSTHMLLLIDQFEELFTVCQDEFVREVFIDNLLAPITIGAGLTLVIALRADFYAHCARYPNLREAVARSQEFIGPMSLEELQRTIEEPARRGGWELEPGLVDLLLHEVGDEPGALPLLSHALLETWKRRRGRVMTLKGYAESGGVRGAIAQTAETVFNELSSDQQAIARDIFLRLTEIGEDGTGGEMTSLDTRRRATFEELIPRDATADAVAFVLKRLTDARLITTSEDSAEVAHEALIREWPRLREWLNEDRAGLVLHRRLTTAAQMWDKLKRDPGELYRGARLAQANEWTSGHSERANELERVFLEASNQREQQEQQEREEQRQRELAAAQKLAESEKQRAQEQTQAAQQMRRRAVMLAGALVVAAILAVAALWFSQQSADNARQAQHEMRIAHAREWTTAALGELNRDPERSILLALQAANETYADDRTMLPETEDLLHRSIQASRLLQTFSIPGPYAAVVNFDKSGTQIVTLEGNDTLKIWDASKSRVLRTITLSDGGHRAAINQVSFSPDGARIATASADLTAKIWDATNGKLLLTLSGHAPGDVGGGLRAGVIDIEFNPNGMRVVTAGADHTAKVWDAATGQLLVTLNGHTAELNRAIYSPEGKHIATVAFDATANIWDAATGELQLTLNGHTDPRIWALAYSPDGTRIATGSRDRTIILWDTVNGKSVMTLTGHTTTVNGVAFSADGKLLASGALDGTTKVWQLSTGQELFTLAGHTDVVPNVVFSPDSLRLYTFSRDQTAKVWSITPGRELSTMFVNARNDFAISPDGSRIASDSEDGTATIWDANTGAQLLALESTNNQTLYHIVFDSTGSRLAAGSADNTAHVWDARTGKLLITLSNHTKTVFGVDFSPDGTRIATASQDGTAKIFDAASGKELLTIPDGGRSDPYGSIRFSPDGSRLAVPGDGFVAKVYDATTGQKLLTLDNHADTLIDVAFSADGKKLATASGDKTTKVWDVATGKLLLTLVGHTNYINDVVFSRDETRIATAGEDNTAKVWDATTGKLLLTLYSPAGVENVAFTPDGTRLVTANQDKFLRVYVLRVEDLLALARSRVTRILTADECKTYLHLEQCPAPQK